MLLGKSGKASAAEAGASEVERLVMFISIYLASC